jgi:hypothetical protein
MKNESSASSTLGSLRIMFVPAFLEESLVIACRLTSFLEIISNIVENMTMKLKDYEKLAVRLK